MCLLLILKEKKAPLYVTHSITVITDNFKVTFFRQFATMPRNTLSRKNI